MPKLKVAVIGVGHLGSRHLKVYHQLRNTVEVIGICDLDADKGQKTAREFQTRFFPDYRTLAGQIQAVNICTPTVNHCETGLFFLEHKIHTFIEKPIAMSIAEADQLIHTASTNNVQLQVGHIERFNSAFQAIKDVAHNPLFVECHRLNHFPARSLDIGVTMDLMIHDIDIVHGLIDAPLNEIRAIGTSVLTDKDDIANARLAFANKTVCNLTASRISPEVMRKIRIFTRDAYISLDYVKQEAFIYRKQGAKIDRTAIPIEKEEPLKKELQDFIRAASGNTKPLVSGIEGREALKTALAIQNIIWTEYIPKS